MNSLHGILQTCPYGIGYLGCILLILMLGWYGAPLAVWWPVTGAILWAVGSPVWLVAIVLAVQLPFLLPPIRRAVITGPLMALLKKLKILPQLDVLTR